MATKKALILENSATSKAILSEIFASTGITTDFVEDPEQALQKLAESDLPYLLIVASSNIFHEHPEEFSLRLRIERNYAHTPLVLLTSHHSDADRQFYAVGYTQIYTRAEIGKFKDYVDQFSTRTAYTKQNQNTVIIIEDDLPQQLVVKAILESHYCECICFTSAEEAIEQSENLQPEVLVVDFFLEGKMTGMEFINEIRRTDHPWQNTPVLATTAMDDPARKYEFLRAGANDYLVKPIETIDLTVRVENLIKYKRLLDKVEEQKEEMHYLAMHDQLTGLYNRHFMASQVGGRIREALRHNIPYSLIVADVDHFKKVNDTWGHDKGDEVLKSVAQLLKNAFRAEDIVARFGGEEFVVFLGHCELSHAFSKADLLRKNLHTARPAGLEVTASFGVAALSPECNSFDKLFKYADEAVYRAKNAGRNRVELAAKE
ncbi:two-component system, cell cycle response regulator [Alteromonadaceae bacterium Bs31]|nr:two-component system, cell cycle response regulator [Alteromonadaceae bacterium Bs31]